jgi:uncharacterized membrane protein
MADVIAGLIMLVIALCGAAIASVGVLALLGRLAPGSRIGIRLGIVTRSEAAWNAAHLAAAPMLIFGGAGVFAVAAAIAPFALAGKIGTFGTILVIMVCFGIMLGSAFSALTLALNAANAAAEPGAHPSP